MDMPDWVTRFPGAVTVSDRNLKIVYFNDKAAATFGGEGGMKLVGGDLLACHHAEKSRDIIRELMASGGQNVYTIDKKGQKKLIYQSAWRDENGEVGGLVELSLVLPDGMPHFLRG